MAFLRTADCNGYSVTLQQLTIITIMTIMTISHSVYLSAYLEPLEEDGARFRL